MPFEATIICWVPVECPQRPHLWEWVFPKQSWSQHWPDDELLPFSIQDTSVRIKGQKFNLGSLLTWFEFSLSPVRLPNIATVCSQIQFVTRVFFLLDAPDVQQHCPHLPEQSHCRAAHSICCYQTNPYLLFSPKPGEIALKSPQVPLCVPAMNLVGTAWSEASSGQTGTVSVTHIHREKADPWDKAFLHAGALLSI